MSRSSSSLNSIENYFFLSTIHLFATNELVLLHNKHMLLSLATPIALSTAKQLRGSTYTNPDEEQLQAWIFLSIGQEVMCYAQTYGSK